MWQISITVAREAEEAAAALLERVFNKRVSIYAPEETPVSIATVYSQQPRRRVVAERQRLREGLRELATFGLEVAPGKISVRVVAREDWAESWKRYFKTIEVGQALLVRPTWSKRRPRAGQRVVVLDPGLSFGTGQHPTTAFCLEELVRQRKTGQTQSVLDIGTGSGILAIAAVKLGYHPVRAFDNDPTAVRIARANARKNRVDGRLVITRQELSKVPLASGIRYDLICANLVHDLLIANARRILNRLQIGGTLVLAGILASQFAEVQAAYEKLGLHLQRCRIEGEWESGEFGQARTR